MPSRARPLLVEGLAEPLAELGKLELVDAVRRVRPDAPPQSQMENSATQAANVLDAFEFGRPDGGALPVRARAWWSTTPSRSGWTMTVVAEGLRDAGAAPVLPFVLWRRP